MAAKSRGCVKTQILRGREECGSDAMEIWRICSCIPVFNGRSKNNIPRQIKICEFSHSLGRRRPSVNVSTDKVRERNRVRVADVLRFTFFEISLSPANRRSANSNVRRRNTAFFRLTILSCISVQCQRDATMLSIADNPLSISPTTTLSIAGSSEEKFALHTMSSFSPGCTDNVAVYLSIGNEGLTVTYV